MGWKYSELRDAIYKASKELNKCPVCSERVRIKLESYIHPKRNSGRDILRIKCDKCNKQLVHRVAEAPGLDYGIIESLPMMIEEWNKEK